MRGQKALLRRPAIYDDALITSIYRYGEADCVVKLFTRSNGRMSAFYKKGYEGTLALGFARIAHERGNEQRMARLYSVDPDPHCFNLGSSLKLFAYSSYIAELIEKLLPEHEIVEPIFALTLEVYQALISHGASSSLLRAFELKLLDFLGYLPEIPRAEEDLFYDMSACCFIREEQTHSFKLSKKNLEIAHELINLPLARIINYEHEELLLIAKIFHSRLKILGLWPLRSLAFFKQVRS